VDLPEELNVQVRSAETSPDVLVVVLAGLVERLEVEALLFVARFGLPANF